MPAPPDADLASRSLGELNDHEIASLTAALKDEQAQQRPLVGPVEPLERLADEYQPGTHYRAKIQRLQADGWTSLRRSRGDGDCFYRAFIFSLLTAHLSLPASSSALLLSTFESLLPLLTACGFEEMVWSDFWEPLRDILRRMGPEEKDGGARKDGEPRLGLDELVRLFNDPETNSCIIVHLRLVTSAYLRTHADDYTPFLFALEDDPRFVSVSPAEGGQGLGGGPPTMAQFCAYHVEAVNREADHLQIVALTRALGTPVRIAYLDQSGFSSLGGGEGAGGGGQGDGVEVNFVEFEDDAARRGAVGIDGALLYRPGHYDMISRA
ncbi:hypothetical protein JCM1840_004923 [Sporobolomyces johnsonii]